MTYISESSNQAQYNAVLSNYFTTLHIILRFALRGPTTTDDLVSCIVLASLPQLDDPRHELLPFKSANPTTSRPVLSRTAGRSYEGWTSQGTGTAV